jgi:ketosteroid isomerase-like protein
MTSLQLSLTASQPQAVFALATTGSVPLVGLVPIELVNGCNEEGCSIESDNHFLTNALRRHYLEHFGHRNLDNIVTDYAEDAVLVHLINGERKSYHGHGQIREAFIETFKQHPTVDSTFRLESIVIRDKVATVTWSAKTPKHDYPQSSDTFRFDANGKISKQFLNGQIDHIATPWFVDDE